MKNLMRVLSGYLIITLVAILLTLLFELNNSFGEVSYKMLAVLEFNILPIISIALCCFCLERGDDNFFVRIITLYMSFAILVIAILVFFCLSTQQLSMLSLDSLTSALGISDALELEGFANILYKIHEFMSSTFLCVTLVSLLFIVETNNAISSIVKKIAFAAIIVNVAMSLWITIKSYMQDTLPNIYDYRGYGSGSGFNFSSQAETLIFAAKVYSYSIIIEAFSVILLFITNYAFSSDTEIDATEIDYETLKKEANKYSNQQINSIYNKPVAKKTATAQDTAPKEIVKDASQTGIMNISNQLGSDSNVGKVQEAAKTSKVEVTDKSLDMPFTTGPVVNSSVTQEQSTTPTQVVPEQAPTKVQDQVQAQPVEQQVEQKDISELMKEKQQAVMQAQAPQQQSAPEVVTEPEFLD